jgi:hypothetical protein
MSWSFGTSDAYSVGLKKLNWKAQEVVPNSLALQASWARENSKKLWSMIDYLPPSYIARLPVIRDLWRILPSLHKVLEFQIKHFNPEVVYFQDLNFASPSLLKKLRKDGRLVVGQIASPLPPKSRIQLYDLILSSLPNQVEQIQEFGVASDFLPIAFDSRLAKRLESNNQRDIDVSFVGGISRFHNTTIPLLTEVAERCPSLKIFGYGREQIADEPKLLSVHGGECWGIDMYRILNRSFVTLNRHISISEDYANNMRLFEATGSGALLVTDQKKNLSSYFEPGTEILTYETPTEAAEVVNWALKNVDEASKIAQRGRARTLSSHTYDECMVKLDAILLRYL